MISIRVRPAGKRAMWTGRSVAWSVAVGTLLTALACDGGTPRDDPGKPQNAPPSADAIGSGLRWSAQYIGAEPVLTLFDARDAPLLRIACEEPARMVLEVETFHPVGSEERLSFGVDGEPFVFVADPTADRRSGVQAEAPINDDLLDRFESAREVAAVYGAQNFGPYMPPDPEMAHQFVSGCRMLKNR
jgi:hypothetical protein